LKSNTFISHGRTRNRAGEEQEGEVTTLGQDTRFAPDMTRYQLKDVDICDD